MKKKVNLKKKKEIRKKKKKEIFTLTNYKFINLK